MLPSKMELRSGSCTPVFTSWTSLWGRSKYLLRASGFLIPLGFAASCCSLEITRSFAFRRLRAFIWFAKWLLSPARGADMGRVRFSILFSLFFLSFYASVLSLPGPVHQVSIEACWAFEQVGESGGRNHNNYSHSYEEVKPAAINNQIYDEPPQIDYQRESQRQGRGWLT